MFFKNKKDIYNCKIFLISLIKVDDRNYNIKYIIDPIINTDIYLGYLFFDIYTDNIDLILHINSNKFGRWIYGTFDFIGANLLDV